jgi:hypothetical protein
MVDRALRRLAPLWWAAAAIVLATACNGGGSSGNPMGPSPNPPPGPPGPLDNAPTFPQVWSINAFDGRSFEFKTNCIGEFVSLATCFLWDVTAVVVEAPGGRRYELEKDFNIQPYSGEVTRRWVLYGPTGAGLPVAGDYRFLYYQGEEATLTQVVSFTPQLVAFPTGITWSRDGNDFVVAWTPPVAASPGMTYKVLLFPPNNGAVISSLLEWNASSARLPDVPLEDGTEATLNVAIYWDTGFAPSEYLPFTW